MQPAKLLRKTWFWIGLALAVYSIFGFLIAPWIAKNVLLETIREDMGREARIEQIRINPYALSVTLHGFSMLEKDGSPFAGFDELYLNFETASLFRWAYSFKEVRLVSPNVRVEIRKDGRFNFSDLIPVSSGETSPDEEKSLIRLWVKRLILDSGKLEFVDSTRPTPFDVLLAPLSIEIKEFNTLPERHGPYSLQASTGEGENLAWSGTVSLNPIQSSGRIELKDMKASTLWRYIRDEVNFEIRQGTFDVTAGYDFSMEGGYPSLNLSETGIALHGFKLGLNGNDQDLMDLPELLVAGASFDLSQRRLHIPRISMRGGRLSVQRNPEGDLDWTKLVPETGKKEETIEPKPEPNVFEVGIVELLTNDFSVAFTDHTTRPATELEVDAIQLKVGDFKSSPGSQFSLDASLRFSGVGDVTLKGLAGTQPASLTASVRIDRFPLIPFQPYLNRVVQLEMDSGDLNLQGDLTYGKREDGPDLRFVGDASLEALSTRDRLVGERFVAWEDLSFSDIEVEFIPNRLGIGSITVKAPYSRVVIARDGSLNLLDVLSPGEATKESTEEQAKEKKKDGQPEGESMPVKIGIVRIEQGSSNFKDLSLTPQFSTGIQELNGEIRGLSSENLARADVSLNGKVGTYGTVAVDGQVNPLSEEAYTDLHVVFRNVELTTLSPYSGKFAGYVIDMGKLSLDLTYKLSKRKLQGENTIVLNQLVLGEQTESPDAVKLPVKLAIALMKDVHGMIDVDLPVRGNLDDPEFSFGGIIVKALINLVTKVVASPFNMLGNLVGADGASMSYVAFIPGSSVLGEGEAEKIVLLAKAIRQRPALRLEVRGSFHPEEDGRAIRTTRFQEDLARNRTSAVQPAEKQSVEILEALFVEQLGKPALEAFRIRFESKAESKEPLSPSPESGKGKGKQPAPEFDPEAYGRALQEHLIEAQPLEEGELRQLAIDRAMAVKDHLVQACKVEDDLIFILESQPVNLVEEGMIRTGLALTGK